MFNKEHVLQYMNLFGLGKGMPEGRFAQGRSRNEDGKKREREREGKKEMKREKKGDEERKKKEMKREKKKK